MRRFLYYIVYVAVVLGSAWFLAGCTAPAPPEPSFAQTDELRPFNRPVASVVTDTPAMRLKLLAGYGPPAGEYPRRWRYDPPQPVAIQPDPASHTRTRSVTFTSTYDSQTDSNGHVNDYYSRRRWDQTRQQTD